MIEKRYIDMRCAQIAEATANGHGFNGVHQIFGIDLKAFAADSRYLHRRLEIAGTGNPAKRATAMLITGGLLLPSHEKVPHESYMSTLDDNGSPWIGIEDGTISSAYNSDPEYLQPCRGPRTSKDRVLTPKMLTCLSYATWGTTVERTSELHPLHDNPRQSNIRTRNALGRACVILDAKTVPQAIAHASFWGVLQIDKRVLDPMIKEPPEPIIFEESVTIPSSMFAHRLSSERELCRRSCRKNINTVS